MCLWIKHVFLFHLDLTKKDNLIIFQSRINPPNYKVALADDLWELPKVYMKFANTHIPRLHGERLP